MLHACVQRFDVTGNLKILAKFLASKRCLCPTAATVISAPPPASRDKQSTRWNPKSHQNHPSPVSDKVSRDQARGQHIGLISLLGGKNTPYASFQQKIPLVPQQTAKNPSYTSSSGRFLLRLNSLQKAKNHAPECTKYRPRLFFKFYHKFHYVKRRFPSH
jgi:hypothetical protein